MKTLIYVILEKLLTDPLNKRICQWTLGISSALFFGNLIIHFLIQNL